MSFFSFIVNKNFFGWPRKAAFFAFFISKTLLGQVFYSTDPNYLQSKPEQNNLISTFENTYPDSTIDELSNYWPRNFMGNYGLASPNYLFNYGTNQLGFQFFDAPTLNDRFREKDILYYRSKGPFASLNGAAGTKQLQVFKLLFTQTYKDRLNFTLRFNRNTSAGYYQKQQSYTNNFYLSSHFSTLSKRFGYYFYILNNGNKNTENGGIRDLVLNDSTALLNKELMGVRISSANRDNRELKIMANPWLRLSGKHDSLNTANQFLQLKSIFSTNSYRYKDVGMVKDNFYQKVYLDTLKTLDSSHILTIRNQCSYVFRNAYRNLFFSLGYKNEINQTWQEKDSVFINQLIGGDWLYKTRITDTIARKQLLTQANFDYVFSGPNSGNYKAESKTTYVINEKQKNYLFANLLAESRNPDQIYKTWTSNHFVWQNNKFKPQEQFQALLGWNLNKQIALEAFYQNIFNYLYFDANALAAQYKKAIENLGLSAKFSVVLFNHLGIYLEHKYQNTSKPTVYRVPQNITTTRLFYHGNLFKNSLQLQIGTQVQVYQSFKALAYMPSTQVFYLQDNSTTAALPFMDIYLNARVRPVTVFLKVENALQGFVGSNYSFVPGYYQFDRAFRFGISWVFFD